MFERLRSETDDFYKDRLLEYGKTHPGTFRKALAAVLKDERKQRDETLKEAELFYADLFPR